MQVINGQDAFEQYSLTPFGCSECGSNACTVIPVMPQLTESREPGLLIECYDCGEEIGMVTITPDIYEMLLRAELDMLEQEGQTEETRP